MSVRKYQVRNAEQSKNLNATRTKLMFQEQKWLQLVVGPHRNTMTSSVLEDLTQMYFWVIAQISVRL